VRLLARFQTRMILCVSLLCLGACSGTTFVYNRLDTIVSWYVDDYVDLDGSQEQHLDDRLRPFLDWHRQQELPRYVALLDQIDSTLDGPVSGPEIAEIFAGMEQAWLRLETESLDWLLDLGATLSDQQVQEFLAYLRDQQQEYAEEYLGRTESEYREQAYDRLRDGMEDYLGRLDAEQRELLRRASQSLQRSDEVWLQERAQWIDRLAVLLQRQPGWQQEVRDAVANRGQSMSPASREVYEHNLGVIFNVTAELLNSRTERQDRHLRKELAALRGDLQTLIAQGQGAPPDAV
jgi:hypothetical protein